MSKHYTMKDPLIEVEFNTTKKATARGGVFVIKAFAQEFGIWERVSSEPALDPRQQKTKGYEPIVNVASFLFGFCTGGTNMADLEWLYKEDGLKAGKPRVIGKIRQGLWPGFGYAWKLHRPAIGW